MRLLRFAVPIAALVACAMLLGAARSGTAMPFTGELSIQILTLDPLATSGSGTSVVTARNGAHLAALEVAGNVFSGASLGIPVTDPLAYPIRGLQATIANEAASFAETAAGRLAGSMPLRGSVKVCLFGACSAAIANILVPLAPIGTGGSTFVSAAVNLTVRGAPWTTGTATIGTVSVQGAARGPAGAASSTAQLDGQLNMVTPVFVSTNIAPSAVVPVFGFLRLGFGSLVSPLCDDGIDNDEDGLVDFPDDPGCGDENDESETDPLAVCDDDRDNDLDGLIDYPADPGCGSLADSSEAPDFRCDVETDRPTYGDGDTVVLSSLRFVNLGSAPAQARVRLQLRLPPAVGFAIDVVDLGAGGGFEVPGSFDNQLGPVTAFAVTATAPIRGSYEWRCALEHPGTGEVFAEDRAAFVVE